MSTAADVLTLAWPAAVCAAAAGGVLVQATVSPRSSFWGPVVSRGNPDRPHVALTFDDGPTPGFTDRVLDTLGELGVRAAFFVVGRNARQHPALVERIHTEGHLVGNHTQDHARLGLLGRDGYWLDQVRLADETVRAIIGRRPALFRPPMGLKTWHTTRATAATGHTIVTWTRRALDGLGTAPPPETIVRRLAEPSEPGDILLLHDGVEPNARRRDRSASVAAVRPLVEQLRARGLEPRPLDELLRVRAYQET